MRKAIAIALLLLLLVSCSVEQSPEQLFNERKSGVVMVLNKFYYRLQLPTGKLLYFTGLDEDGAIVNLTASEPEARNHAQQSFGTAFFIDHDGTMLTNRHVASPPIDKEMVKSSFSTFVRSLITFAEFHLEYLRGQYDKLERQKAMGYYYEDIYGEIQYEEADNREIEQQQLELEQQYNQIQSVVSRLSSMSDPSEFLIEPVCQLGVTYDGSFVNSPDNFLVENPCVVMRTSGDEEVDLALLQLKTHKTPAQAYVFSVEGNHEKSFMDRFKVLFGKSGDEELSITSKLYMIGYNAGIIVANTRKGIKAQMTTGTVSQQPDGDRVLYSIPAVEGSSGSPVIDENGNLVAVNFAKLAVGHAENFNFGISLEQIQHFLK